MCDQNPSLSSPTHEHGAIVIKKSSDFIWLLLAFIVLSAYTLIEFVLGIMINAVILQTDASHLLIDDISLLLATVVSGYAYAHGHSSKIAEILVSAFNAVLLIAFAVYALVKGYQRCMQPQILIGSVVLLVAIGGLVVNALVTILIMHAHRESLNVQGALQHVISDLFGSAITCISGIIILFWRNIYVDGVGSICVGLFMLISGIVLIRKIIVQYNAHNNAHNNAQNNAQN